MKSPGKLRRSEFATSELPSVLIVKLSDDTLTLELPDTMVNCSPSLSPLMPRFVVVVCTKGCTLTIGATDTMALTSGMTKVLTSGRTSGVTTVCTDTTGSTETMGLTIVRTDAFGAGGATGASATGAVTGATGGSATAATGAGVAAGCADCTGGTAGGCVACGAGCCAGVAWKFSIVGRKAAIRQTTGIASSKYAITAGFFRRMATLPFHSRIRSTRFSACPAVAMETPCHQTRPGAASSAAKKPSKVSA